MRGRPILSASILAADFTQLGSALQAAEAGGADWIHIDVMDGHFVPALTMGPFVVEACRRATRLPLDVHLMVDRPETQLTAFRDAGADALTVHVEACPQLYRTLETIRELGVKPGAALNPGTPVAALEDVLPLLDRVLVMSVNPGAYGQPFLEGTPAKLTRVRTMREAAGSTAWIEVDGGISPETIGRAASAGAEAFVAASAIFGHPQGIQAGLQSLRDALERSPAGA
ncbi:MAG TPA: ribulose-phosphate 3-epimerase [Anaerolineales bacterium]|nr:ribulose-phosphate 3-epimerase [Anaerolineales bacterium]